MGSAPWMGWSKSSTFYGAPGPNAYRPNSAVGVKSSPGWGFGKEKRDKKARAQSPGPGAYTGKYQVTKKKGPSYPLGIKTKSDFRYLNHNPGPGTYSQDFKSKGGWSFGGRNKTGREEERKELGSSRAWAVQAFYRSIKVSRSKLRVWNWREERKDEPK